MPTNAVKKKKIKKCKAQQLKTNIVKKKRQKDTQYKFYGRQKKNSDEMQRNKIQNT